MHSKIHSIISYRRVTEGKNEKLKKRQKFTDRQTEKTNRQTNTITEKAKTIYPIAPDKTAYCVFTQFRERENAIKFISVRTKTQ